ncbi:uncharacterized protein LOC122093865 [Macadamia integrifolia]|uniref:uncharacterized protein LOC122093865 n=1 Tax=Macadamia integrifolia TaxID=60698 RepID=UPI001C4E7930|nr:uncharacterized protein LOC122093865 [Macadamia integrifolia]
MRRESSITTSSHHSTLLPSYHCSSRLIAILTSIMCLGGDYREQGVSKYVKNKASGTVGSPPRHMTFDLIAAHEKSRISLGGHEKQILSLRRRGLTILKKLRPRTVLEALHKRITALLWEILFERAGVL